MILDTKFIMEIKQLLKWNPIWFTTIMTLLLVVVNSISQKYYPTYETNILVYSEGKSYWKLLTYPLVNHIDMSAGLFIGWFALCCEFFEFSQGLKRTIIFYIGVTIIDLLIYFLLYTQYYLVGINFNLWGFLSAITVLTMFVCFYSFFLFLSIDF